MMDLGKEMKEIIKEATIKFLKNLNADKDKMNNVINFLKRGWKYEEIVKELNNRYGTITYCHPIQNERFSTGNETTLYLSEIIKDFEQNYKVVK